VTAPPIPDLFAADALAPARAHLGALPQLTPTSAVLNLDPAPTAPRAARAFTRAALKRWQLPDLIDDAAKVVSELVTNALVHAERPDPATPITLRLRRQSDCLHVEVDDQDPQHLPNFAATATDSGGRGLFLVAALAGKTGASTTATTKTVWADLAA